MFICKTCECSLPGKILTSISNKLKKLEKDLKIFSVKSRLEILYILNQCNHCVVDVIEHTGMSQSLTSHHLADLTIAGFVQSQRQGKFMDYSLTDKGQKFIEALNYLVQNEMKGGDSRMTCNPLKKICDCLCECCKCCKDCCEKKKEDK